MKLNPDKCHLFLSNEEQDFLKIGNLNMRNSLCKKLLGMKFDCKVNFTNFIEGICQKESRKLKCTCNTGTIHNII